MDVNRLHWNELVPLHHADRTGFYEVDAVREGTAQLMPIERAELGDVGGKRIVHLQCHFGLDSLKLARLGASVVGLDYSPPAIETARRLAAETGLAATFVLGNLYDAPTLIRGRFDIAYVTWGAICWLPDIRRWAEIVAGFLAPGGFLYLLEGHPSTLALEQEDGRLVARYPWRSAPDAPIRFDEPTTYTGDAQSLTHTETWCWHHPLSSVIGGLLDAGLTLDFLHEHETLAWKLFPMMVEAGEGMFRLPDGASALPLAYSLRARKPERSERRP
jgi:SAM-dependent methyltransferase